MITFSQLGEYGRLGNQMFQYALLVGVAEKRGFEIAIPAGPLQCFGITAPRSPRQELASYRPIYREPRPAFCFDADVFAQPDGTDYVGYFQSYLYFDHAAERIRAEFSFTPRTCRFARSYLTAARGIAGQRSLIFVSVRRGDYLQYPGLHIPFSLDYFEQARRALPAPALYVVSSDDLPWACEHLQGSEFFYLDHADPYVCLCVGTHCDHYICSGGTYAWWAAWLGTHPDKQVAIPSPWYGPEFPLSEEHNQMSPPDWIRVSLD